MRVKFSCTTIVFNDFGHPHAGVDSVGIDDLHRRLAPVAAMDKESDLAVDIGHSAVERFHVGEAVLPDIVNETLENIGLRSMARMRARGPAWAATNSV